jgi:putative hydrolase of the HAD superfamily
MKLEQPQSIRTIFFDAGFTLLQPHPSDLEIYQQVCQTLSLQISTDQLAQQITVAEDFYFSHVRSYPYTWASDQDITAFWIEYYARVLRPFIAGSDEKRLYQCATLINDEFAKHTSWQVYTDVYETLDALHQRGYTLGIISDWGISLGPILSNLKLTKYFECVIISASARQAKPSPILYDLALQRANSIADYALHIGDSYINDVIGARTVGITPVLLDRAHRVQAQALDCLLVHSLTELLDILEVDRLESDHQKA